MNKGKIMQILKKGHMDSGSVSLDKSTKGNDTILK